MLCNRIFVITCRGGKALLFDNKPDSKGKRHYKKFTGPDSRIAGIKAWCYMLNMIPDEFTSVFVFNNIQDIAEKELAAPDTDKTSVFSG